MSLLVPDLALAGLEAFFCFGLDLIVRRFVPIVLDTEWGIGTIHHMTTFKFIVGIFILYYL